MVTTLMGKMMTMRLVMMITIKSVAPTRVSIAEDQSVVAVPSLTIPPPVLFRTKQMSNISYSRHQQNFDIFSPCFILYHLIKLWITIQI